MRLSWAQTATGALLLAAVIGLALLPARVLGPSSAPDRGSLSLPARAHGSSVQALPALPVSPVVSPRRASPRRGVPVTPPVAQLASAPVGRATPVVDRVRAPVTTRPTVRVVRRRVPPDEARPAAPAAPAPVPAPAPAPAPAP